MTAFDERNDSVTITPHASFTATQTSLTLKGERVPSANKTISGISAICPINPVSHANVDGFLIDALFQNFLAIGPVKADLRRFLNNADIFHKLQGTYRKDLSALDKTHFDLLQKYLDPFPDKIQIERIPNAVGKMSEFLFKLQDVSKSTECFSLPLVSDLSKSKDGRTLKEVIRENRQSCQVLAASNPLGFVHYYVIKFDDFFIDSKTCTKFSDKFIEIYKFSRFMVFQTLYPFTDIFGKVLEYFVSNYRQAKLNKFVQLVNENKTTIADYESLDSESFPVIESLQIDRMLRALDANVIGSDFGYQMSLPMTDKVVKFLLPERKDCPYVECGRDLAKVLLFFPFEELMLLVSSMISERTIVFVSKRQKKITRTIATLVAFLKPLNWVYPLIYSLPQECITMLAAPVPLIAGVLCDSHKFLKDYELKVEFGHRKNPPSRNTVICFLDSGIIKCPPELVTENHLPLNVDLLRTATNAYKESFNSRASKFVKMETSKSKGSAKLLPRSPLVKFQHSLLDKEIPFEAAEPQPNVDIKTRSAELFGMFSRMWNSYLEMPGGDMSASDEFAKALQNSQLFAYHVQEKAEEQVN